MRPKSSVETWLNGKTILGFWLLVSLLNSLPSLVLLDFEALRISYGNHLAGNLILGGCCALLTPVVLRLSARLPIRAPRGLLHLLAHVAGSLAFSALALALYLLCTAPLFDHPTRPFADQVFYMGRFFFNQVVVYYWLLVLVHHVLATADRLRREEVSSARMREQLTGARLESLQARLRPHFLFNSLNGIAALVRLEKNDQALDAVEELGDLLRLSLGHGEEALVPLERELSFIERYLDVERRRFPDRLQVDYAITPEARRASVPPLLLQPLVENAIKHGIGKRSDAGRIRLEAEREGEELRLAVVDDGPGLANGTRGAHPCRSGVGLRSTRERLRVLYPERHTLELHNVVPHGLATTLRIPWREAAG